MFPKISNRKRSVILFVRVLAWFSIILTTLSILGFSELATTLGTATGFIALAVSYGLKDIIGQFVSGVYLMESDDFVEGAKVTSDGVTGIVEKIGIRQTKIRDSSEDAVHFVANNKIESKWKLYEDDEKTE